MTGRAGTVAFADTSRCFHFGSRVSEGAPPRRMMLFQYLTPYAFEFESDHRAEAPLREAADGTNDELAAASCSAPSKAAVPRLVRGARARDKGHEAEMSATAAA